MTGVPFGRYSDGMAHVEVIAAFTAFAGLVLAWLAVPHGVHVPRRASEPAPVFEQIAA